MRIQNASLNRKIPEIKLQRVISQKYNFFVLIHKSYHFPRFSGKKIQHLPKQIFKFWIPSYGTVLKNDCLMFTVYCIHYMFTRPAARRGGVQGAPPFLLIYTQGTQLYLSPRFKKFGKIRLGSKLSLGLIYGLSFRIMRHLMFHRVKF